MFPGMEEAGDHSGQPAIHGSTFAETGGMIEQPRQPDVPRAPEAPDIVDEESPDLHPAPPPDIPPGPEPGRPESQREVPGPR